MAIPTLPYCTSEQVALLVPNLLNTKTDFDDVTFPKKTSVDYYINLVGNQVNMQFQQAGYIYPFVELTGETWPDHQTLYLQTITSLGAAAWAAGYSLKPAPAIGAGNKLSTGNIFQDMFNQEMTKIWNRLSNTSNVRFRCMAYSGTPAEVSIMQPIGPTMDYMEGKTNPERFYMLEAYTDLKYSISNYMEQEYGEEFTWHDFHGLVNNSQLNYSYVK